ncbi:CHAT domain-containing protein [Amycolatopsis pretoriensis]|uniref:CHAT domain-containing protein n=1 Tax=Amycolatopsis pretoriensis TaxID=218821 RepID=A0A1H5RDS3_9PSEU|nr:CHAT domain-containing protein [Amycolatopsis pretoriensis]SEF36500.1 CHAT domain-containing protein [Amycolatopsis pretoriensis]
MIRAELLAGELNVGRATDLTLRLTNGGGGTCTNIVFTLRLPPQVPAVRGNRALEASRLAPGESCDAVVRVRPRQAGRWQATSTNFSFRDQHGAAFRVADFSSPLVVAAEVEDVKVPLPRFDITLSTPVLAHGEWDTLRGYVSNTGPTPISWGRLSLQGPLVMDPNGVTADLGYLQPGEQEPFTFHVLAREAGREVPVRITAMCVDGAAQRVETAKNLSVQVGHAATANSGQVRILYLAANPSSFDRLRLAEEVRDIKQTLRYGKQRDRFELAEQGAMRARDLTQALLDFAPRIVHLSGHGAEDGRFVAEAEGGGTRLLSTNGVAALFKEVSDTVECVIVNACYSEDLAQSLSEHISYVIGMRSWIGDQSAMDFSVGFYQALVAGRAIEPAYRIGKAAMVTGNSHGRGGEVPVLFRRS